MVSIPENLKQLISLLEKSSSNEETGSRFRLPKNNQMARISFARSRFKRGRDESRDYFAADVTLDVPRNEQAIIAALVALRGKRKKDQSLFWRKLRRTGIALRAARWERQALKAMLTGEPKPDIPPELEGAKQRDTSLGRELSYLEDLLRYYRPEYDNLSLEDQVGLVKRSWEKANEFLKALEELTLCLQHAHPEKGLPTNPIKEAERDVRAAEYRHIEGLSYPEIGKRLGVSQSEHDRIKNDHRRVRKQLVPNGEQILKQALGDDGYDKYIENSKAERARYRQLSEDDQEIEHWADTTDIPVQSMHRIMYGTEEEFIEERDSLEDSKGWEAAWARAAWLNLPRG